MPDLMVVMEAITARCSFTDGGMPDVREITREWLHFSVYCCLENGCRECKR